jgi:hypothetical protein
LTAQYSWIKKIVEEFKKKILVKRLDLFREPVNTD